MTIRTYIPRRGRVSERQATAIAEAGGLLLPMGAEILDLGEIFAGLPVVLEVGFGTGSATVTMAESAPDLGILAVDVHTPGLGIAPAKDALQIFAPLLVTPSWSPSRCCPNLPSRGFELSSRTRGPKRGTTKGALSHRRMPRYLHRVPKLVGSGTWLPTGSRTPSRCRKFSMHQGSGPAG